MSTGVAREEGGLLKLVYPKGRVELHKRPITAAEVLERNPRCCVTRPDVFKFPWIVVRPESILSLGRVFFVVPCHTIRRLLQKHGMSPTKPPYGLLQQRKPQEHQPPIWSLDVSSGNESEHLENYNIEQRPSKPLTESTDQFHRLVRSSSQKMYNARLNNKQVINDLPKKQYPVEHWPKDLSAKKLHQQQKFKPYDSGCGSLRRNKGGLEAAKCNDKVTKLKPCLKKQGANAPRSRGLKVTFDVPVDNKKWDIKVYDLQESFLTSRLEDDFHSKSVFG